MASTSIVVTELMALLRRMLRDFLGENLSRTDSYSSRGVCTVLLVIYLIRYWRLWTLSVCTYIDAFFIADTLATST